MLKLVYEDTEKKSILLNKIIEASKGYDNYEKFFLENFPPLYYHEYIERGKDLRYFKKDDLVIMVPNNLAIRRGKDYEKQCSYNNSTFFIGRIIETYGLTLNSFKHNDFFLSIFWNESSNNSYRYSDIIPFKYIEENWNGFFKNVFDI